MTFKLIFKDGKLFGKAMNHLGVMPDKTHYGMCYSLEQWKQAENELKEYEINDDFLYKDKNKDLCIMNFKIKPILSLKKRTVIKANDLFTADIKDNKLINLKVI